MSETSVDDTLVQKLVQLNRRLTHIATTKSNTEQVNTQIPKALESNLPSMGKPKSSSHMKTLNRISSLEDYITNMTNQLNAEFSDNKKLNHILHLRSNSDIKSTFQSSPELQMLTKTVSELRNNLNNSKRQLQKERREFSHNMMDAENQLRILKTEQNAYKQKMDQHVKRELSDNSEISKVRITNVNLKSEIEDLRKKIKDCNDTITSNNESKKTLISQINTEKCNLQRIIDGNEGKVKQLRDEVGALNAENNRLELGLRDRDNLHEQLLKNKKLYENALGELLNAKKEQSEFEKQLKQKMFSLNGLEKHIEALDLEKISLKKEVNALKSKYQQEKTVMVTQNGEKLKKIQTECNYTQKKHKAMKSKHSDLKKNLASKAAVCDDIKKKIFAQKSMFEENLNALIANHSKNLQELEADTGQIKDILDYMQQFSNGSANDIGSAENEMKEKGEKSSQLRGISMNNCEELLQAVSAELCQDDFISLGIWEPQ